MADLPSCHDCGAAPGTEHADGCDTARCLATGRQRLSCDGWHVTETLSGHGVPLGIQEAHDCGRDIWTGKWPGEDDAIRLGFWTRWTDNGWERCGPGDPDAQPDLNRLNEFNARWDPAGHRWEALSDD